MKKPRKKSVKVVPSVNMAEIDAANRARIEATPFMQALRGVERSAGNTSSFFGSVSITVFVTVFLILCVAGCPQ